MSEGTEERARVAVQIERLEELVAGLEVRMQEGPHDLERRFARVVEYFEIFAADVCSESVPTDSISRQVLRLENALQKIEGILDLNSQRALPAADGSCPDRLELMIDYLTELVEGTY